ncbi:putative uncharacterized protein DDB_G0277255 [Nilaparvata lugens]|uniref:putative uncharacterized protein DDB_G0277255 n=1 Tax=Nilaparvata lugens TaxID=108931 RepID=UPI00193D5B41|nr:putative uncharacterized protein DDB_G0277255 [Nilaparvata lugens]
MADGSTTDFSSAEDQSPGGKHPRSNSLTSEAFSQDVLHHMSSTQLNATDTMQERMSPTRVTAETPQGDVMQQVAPAQPSSAADGNPPLIDKTNELRKQLYHTLPSPEMADSMLNFIKEMGEEQRTNQKNLERNLIQVIQEAHTNMNSRLDRMQESFKSEMLNHTEGLRKEMKEKNTEIKKYTDQQTELTRAEMGAQISEQNNKFTALTSAVEVRLNTTLADHNLGVDSKLKEIELKQIDTTKKVDRIEEEVQLLKNNNLILSSSSELSSQVTLAEAKLSEIKNSLASMASAPRDNNLSQILNSIPNFDNSYGTILPRAFTKHLLMVNDMYNVNWNMWKLNLISRLQGEPLIFFQSRLEEFTDLNHFVKALLDTFWSPDRQRVLLTHIITCKFQRNAGLSMVAFSAHLKYLNSALDHPIPLDSLIQVLAQKLPKSVQTALSTRDFENYNQFESCLYRLQFIHDQFESNGSNTSFNDSYDLGCKHSPQNENVNRGPVNSRSYGYTKTFSNNDANNYQQLSSNDHFANRNGNRFNNNNSNRMFGYNSEVNGGNHSRSTNTSRLPMPSEDRNRSSPQTRNQGNRSQPNSAENSTSTQQNRN